MNAYFFNLIPPMFYINVTTVLHTSHQILNPNVTNNAAVKVIVHIKTQTITSTNADKKLESRPL